MGGFTSQNCSPSSRKDYQEELFECGGSVLNSLCLFCQYEVYQVLSFLCFWFELRPNETRKKIKKKNRKTIKKTNKKIQKTKKKCFLCRLTERKGKEKRTPVSRVEMGRYLMSCLCFERNASRIPWGTSLKSKIHVVLALIYCCVIGKS